MKYTFSCHYILDDFLSEYYELDNEFEVELSPEEIQLLRTRISYPKEDEDCSAAYGQMQHKFPEIYQRIDALAREQIKYSYVQLYVELGDWAGDSYGDHCLDLMSEDLEKGLFVPRDEDGNPVEPYDEDGYFNNRDQLFMEWQSWEYDYVMGLSEKDRCRFYMDRYEVDIPEELNSLEYEIEFPEELYA